MREKQRERVKERAQRKRCHFSNHHSHHNYSDHHNHHNIQKYHPSIPNYHSHRSFQRHGLPHENYHSHPHENHYRQHQNQLSYTLKEHHHNYTQTVPAADEDQWTVVKRRNRKHPSEGRRAKGSAPNTIRISENRGNRDRSCLVTVYVDNLLPQVEANILRRTFETFGSVRDSYIPQKQRRYADKKYGFVRFDSLTEAKEVVYRSNGTRCLGVPMTVKLASFGWERRGHNQRAGTKIAKNQRVVKDGKEANRDIRLYSEVLKGKSKPVEGPSMNYDGDLETKQWLEASAVASIRNVQQDIPLHQLFFDAEIEMECIAPTGGDSFLITFANKEAMLDTLENEKTFFREHFKFIEPWSPQLMHRDRVVWILCLGIPLQMWSLNFFKSLGEVWGSLIAVDEETFHQRNLTQARILISTETVAKISGKVPVNWMGGTTLISVTEEPISVNYPGLIYGNEEPRIRRTVSWVSQNSEHSSDDLSPKGALQAERFRPTTTARVSYTNLTCQGASEERSSVGGQKDDSMNRQIPETSSKQAEKTDGVTDSSRPHILCQIKSLSPEAHS